MTAMQTVSLPFDYETVADLRSRLGLSRERMARLFDVSAKTIERWEIKGTLPPAADDRRRFGQLLMIIELGRIVYGDEGLQLFLRTPMPVFDGMTALELIERNQEEIVYSALAADYEGLGP
jgi:transcriptional regulator with XRE-family HTH domain